MVRAVVKKRRKGECECEYECQSIRRQCVSRSGDGLKREAQSETHTQTDRQTDRQAGRQADKGPRDALTQTH